MVEEAQEPPALSLLDLPSHVLDAVFSLALRLHQDALEHSEDRGMFDVRKRDPRRCARRLPPLLPAILQAAWLHRVHYIVVDVLTPDLWLLSKAPAVFGCSCPR